MILLNVSHVGYAKMEDDWEKARSENTISAYEEFLQKYSEGAFVQEAQKRLEELYWKRAQTVNTIFVYEEFLEKYPDGTFSQEAHKRIKNLKEELSDWEKAKSEDTISAYKAFLQKHPDGMYAQYAQEALKRPPTPTPEQQGQTIITGKLIHEKTKEPISGMDVMLVQAKNTPEEPDTYTFHYFILKGKFPVAKTNKDGIFEIADIPIGLYGLGIVSGASGDDALFKNEQGKVLIYKIEQNGVKLDTGEILVKQKE